MNLQIGVCELKKFGFWKRKVSLALVFAMLQVSFLHIFAVTALAADGEPELDVSSAILMEASTGQILFEKNADQVLPPASMSKMMTEYLVMEAIHNGKLKWEDTATASKYAASVIGSGQLIAEGETLTIKDLFYAMSIYSSNDASIVLAEKLGGSEEGFAKLMNDKARELGMSDKAQFINATGLSRADIKENAPKSIQGETVMSAKDVAILARHLVTEHKEVLEYTKVPSKKLRESDKSPMINYNWMLEGNSSNVNFKKYAYQGLDGLKTGHTDEAKYCFTGTAERNGMRLISVVMGAKTEPERFNQTRKVLDYGFTNFEFKTLAKAGTALDAQKTVPITKGVELEAPAVLKNDVAFAVKKGTADTKLETKVDLLAADKLVAPLKKGDKLGTATLSFGKNSETVDLVAENDMEKASWFRMMMRAIKNLFADLFNGVKGLF
ncbi:D-alanyl-D-alanine carboxypeptidase family protein [Paenibacillus sp. HGF7]|uniref:D-alanyl-D-alanine carboxypeptidase family protein n=1 Tax=Paenibacillus sp. HGF7 TaxID=944559 RepID=UPI0020166504|nr:D-alanyl-D-alanine carboxypeptidase family protein [Paenibacillus sp. HGF7]